MLTRRRDFLKLCTMLGVGTVLNFYSYEISQVFAQAAQKKHVVWLQGGSDSGCSISILQAAHPDLVDAVIDFKLAADYWTTVMTPEEDPRYDLGWWSAGYRSEDTSNVPLTNAVFGNAPVDALIVEGTVQTGTPKGGAPGEYCVLTNYEGRPVTMWEAAQKLYQKAAYTVAYGQCSAFGNIPSAKGNVTESMSLVNSLKKAFVYDASKPVINIAGCPGHPDWMLLTLASALQGFKPDLDELGRPRAFFNQFIHDGCPRRGYYDKGEFAVNYDDPQCLWKLGCRGPITVSHCAITRWNNGVGFCTQQGPMCWGCMHPNFPDSPAGGDPTQPVPGSFFNEIEAAPSLLGINVNTAILAMGGAAAIGIAAHAVRRKGGKPPPEEIEVEHE